MKLNYRWVFFLLCVLAFAIVVRQNSRTSAEAKEKVDDDIYLTGEVITSRYEIYEGDYSTYKSKVAKSLELDQNLETIDILKKVVNSLSQTLYNDLPIDVRIEDRDSKKVAIVNLIEPLSSNNSEFKKLYEELDDKSQTWQYYFSSGDAKSIVTLASLNDTLSQKSTTGKWIDGYMIFHNGETLDDHRKLSTTDITWLR